MALTIYTNIMSLNAQKNLRQTQAPLQPAMDEMINGVQRIYELAQQAASYNTSADRSSLNQEVTELQSELSRIVTQTRYNGEQFLNQQKSVDIQVGTEVKETINISTSSLSPNTM